MKVVDLKPHPENPRTITDDKVRMLKRSMETVGDVSGIFFNERTQRLGGGHQRLKVIPLDADIVITERFPEKTERGTVAYGYVEHLGERFQVRIVDWDELTEKVANLTANSQWGEWDEKKRDEWYIELDNNNVDFELIGKTREEIGDLLNRGEFMPGSIEDQGKLDEKKPVECPSCGHKFTT